MTLTFDLLTLKVVSEFRLTWATSVPILVFLGLSVLDLGPMYAADVRQHHRLMPSPRGGGIKTEGQAVSVGMWYAAMLTFKVRIASMMSHLSRHATTGDNVPTIRSSMDSYILASI